MNTWRKILVRLKMILAANLMKTLNQNISILELICEDKIANMYIEKKDSLQTQP